MHVFVRIGLVLLCASACARLAPSHGFEANGILVFMSDFGTGNDAVALCKGVMLGVEDELRIVDLTHDVTPFNIREGAFYLNEAVDHFPQGTVFVAVVDPGVGTQRRAIVLETNDGKAVIAPDNGLASLVARDHGVRGAWEISNPKFMYREQTSTFHGRDIFAPAGAVLAAARLSPKQAGTALTDWVRIELPAARRDGDSIVGEVLLLDKPFGNVWTNIPRSLMKGLEGRVTVAIADSKARALSLVSTFGDVGPGESLAYFNSRDYLSFAVHRGDYATTHGVEAGMRVEVSASE